MAGMPGSKSRVDLPKRQLAGDMPVSGLGPFRYCRRARWNWSLRAPPGPVFPAMSLLVDLTATSALQFPWGLYAEATLWWTLQDLRKARVECAENSGPPSEVRVSGMP